MRKYLLTHLQSLSLWALLPLLLALVPYQPINPTPDLTAAIASHPASVLIAPLKTTFAKPAPPDLRRHLPPLLDTASNGLPPHQPGFDLVQAAPTAPSAPPKLTRDWHARAPPFVASHLI